MKYKIIVISLLLSACGPKESEQNSIKIVNTELKETAAAMMEMVQTTCTIPPYSTLEIKFVESLPGDVIGQCITVGNKLTIEIEKTYWDSVDQDERDALMLHELTHCLLRKHAHHSDPKNYFNAYLPDGLTTTLLHDQLLGICK